MAVLTSNSSTVIAWYRPSIRRPLLRRWFQSLFLVTAGSSCLFYVGYHKLPFESYWIFLYFFSMLLVVSGPFWLIRTTLAIMNHERCLVIKRNGILWLESGKDAKSMAWEDMESIRGPEDALRVSESWPKLMLYFLSLKADKAHFGLEDKTEDRAPKILILGDGGSLALPLRFEGIGEEELVALLWELRRKRLMGLPMRMPTAS